MHYLSRESKLWMLLVVVVVVMVVVVLVWMMVIEYAVSYAACHLPVPIVQ